MNQSEEREKNRLKTIRVAQELFLSEGVANTSINRIAKEAGLAAMSVYRYFGNKETLVDCVWQDALVTFYEQFMSRYTDRLKNLNNGYEKFVACMGIYIETYLEFPQWFGYTREMLNLLPVTGNYTGGETHDVFWKYYDAEIPIPLIKSLIEGKADGSIRSDISIQSILQIIINGYTGTNIYINSPYKVDSVDIMRLTSEIIAKYIKNDDHI